MATVEETKYNRFLSQMTWVGTLARQTYQLCDPGQTA